MIFSNNASMEFQEKIKLVGCNSEIQQYEKYLSLPPIVGRSKIRAFQVIKQRVWQKLQTWMKKLLYQGGKEVLMKAIALSIPAFSMNCFLLPYDFCSELESLIAKSLWCQKAKERRTHWLAR